VKMAREWFGNGVDLRAPEVWVGRRPMTPDGPPVLGETPVPGLLLNIGHGSTGWAMSMGSARVIADLACERLPEIDLEGLTLARYA
jgi:D-amino-acid dehydrogenase